MPPKLPPRFTCHDCGGYNDEYMVRHQVWLEAWPDYPCVRAEARLAIWRRFDPDGTLRETRRDEIRKIERQEMPHFLLCLSCLELRLGRNLEIEDFTAAPINRGVRLGFAIGRR